MTSKYDPAQVTQPLEVARQAALVGGASAIPGTVIGALYGTVRTQTPVLFSIASGAQWFALGSTFWGFRTSLLNQNGLLNWWNLTRGAPIYPRDDLNPSPSDKVRASTIAGGSTGFTLGFLFRGPRNVIPGTLVFSLVGWLGQCGYNYLDARNSGQLQELAELRAKGEERPKESLMHKIAKSRWSPMQVLTDEDYEKMMQEKLLRVEADIAMIDDKIAALRKQAVEKEAQHQIKHVHEQDKISK
ncbi:hypothetical protein COCC4DRAFT_143191 [Bipolaris maydis ATCC 48331]|uniref:Uncharacterized protein n=2 Tax=Cochliobolus heterostrophus TaxID=5016 RepID=M2U1N8_COCH5|nr:uncharacterized protein COCC4DRAFT_143191 [Bipolaris maydis ATCC 48331]EMD87946.1 hypothetical protein COCHEDRAFT_1227217 [Bipolaris maydis C5]KAH7552183.1 hypothetical protein BM1_09045 [Bipolaris maydis]ENI03461.1 hypothetical protein COCC4DRAFT_143191 [Bipolaris maydis ATCC 48331]KAJ5024229.1 hypothetical protein J3E73DRAFT_327219 [Bipolaris maydis]KAJ5057623.1 hypothetical protein J3E74DRAFT_9202 [Bipolaris maydis]